MHHRAVAGAMVVLVAIMLACAPSEERNKLSSSNDIASLKMALVETDYTGNSVRITGARTPFADGKYRCDNIVDACFNFASDGTTDVLIGLCPSENVPVGTWDFSYEVYQGLDCEGDTLPNFNCLATLDETLPAGVITTNYVLCGSFPADKTWDFDSVNVDPDCPDGATCIPASQ